MSNYTYQTGFFGDKDFLPQGNPLKIVLGEDFEREFVNIDVAIRTKMDLASPTFTGTLSGQGMTLLGNFSGTSADFSGEVTFEGSIAGTPTGNITLQAGGSGTLWSQGTMWLASLGGELVSSAELKTTLSSVTNNVEINALQGVLDLNAASFDFDAAGNIDILSQGQATFYSKESLYLTSTEQNVRLSSTLGSAIIRADNGILDLNAASFDFDATGPIAINGTSTLNMFSEGAMWLAAVNSPLLVTATQDVNLTSTDADIILTANAGVLDLNASSFDFDASANINIKSVGSTTHVSDGYFSISAPNTNLGITAGNILDLNAGNFDLDSDDTIAINSVGVTTITANTGLFLTSTTTNIGITSTLGSVVISANSGTLDLNAASFDFDSTGPVSINGTTATNISSVGTMAIGSSTSTATISAFTGLTLGTTGGNVVVNANAGVLDLNAASFYFDATGGINLTSGVSGTVFQSTGNIAISSSTLFDVFSTKVKIVLVEYANNAAALAAGLTENMIYRTPFGAVQSVIE